MTPISIKHICPRNFLSFGPEFPGVDLQALNVLIGPNGCGKSNLIEALAFMRAAPKDFQEVTRKGGGVAEWVWKGEPTEDAEVSIFVPIEDGQEEGGSEPYLQHLLRFCEHKQAFHLSMEWIIRNAPSHDSSGKTDHYLRDRGKSFILAADGDWKEISVEFPHLSILAQRRDPDAYPMLSLLANTYGMIRIYREWSFGRSTPVRDPQRADMPEHPLAEDFSNLGLFLNNLMKSPKAKRLLLQNLSQVFEGATDLHIGIKGGTVQIFLQEGDYVVPATRLSDGTLHYLCLLAILCDPEPPALVCIEEPELGLHPDIIPTIADLLVALSERTQVIITTHSDILIDCMTERPESVIVCEKHQGQTEMKRLSKDDLAVWLEKYRLGQLWMDGEIGGKRW